MTAADMSIRAQEQARFDASVLGEPVPITSLRELRRLKQRSVLERGSGHLPGQEYPVHPEPPWEGYQSGLTNLDRALSRITSPVQLTRWERWIGGGAGPVPSSFTPPMEEHVERVTYRIRRSSSKSGGVTDPTMQWYRSLVPRVGVLGFEILGTEKDVAFQVSIPETEASHVVSQLRTHSPDVAVELADDALYGWDPDFVINWSLGTSAVFPIASPSFSEPLNTLMGVLEALEPDELAGIQLLIAPVAHDWTELFETAIGTGLEAAPGASILESALREKINLGPLFSVVIRSFATEKHLAERLEAFFHLFGGTRNHLEPRARVSVTELVDRSTVRYGMLLSTRELTSLCHLPSSALRTSKLGAARRTRGAPRFPPREGDLVIGENHHQGIVTPVVIPAALRMRHTHIVGVSGSGKSTLLARMILSDIEAGSGVCVLDPHGDLVDGEILPRIPENRIRDVIYLDPVTAPIPINLLIAHTEDEREHLAEDLVGIFKRFSVGWGTQLESILAHAILAILNSSRGGHLGDLRDFLIDPAIRAEYLESITDPHAASFFKSEFKMLPKQACAPVLTRLSSFLRRKCVRDLICHRESNLDFREAMDSSKIILVKMGTGSLGEENAHLLGSLIVAKLHQASLSRQNMRADDRRPFHLYMDEFQHFVTPSLEAILSGGRKHGLALTLAHQELEQVMSKSREVGASVMANPATRICFSVGERDAAALAKSFAHFEAEDLTNLSRGEAIVRLERADCDFTLLTQPLDKHAPDADERARAVREESARKYGSFSNNDEEEGDLDAEIIEPDEIPPVPDDLPRPPPPPPPRREPPPTPVEGEIDWIDEDEDEAEPPAPPPSPPLDETEEPPLPGKGGPEHRALQALIRRLGEERGFRATVESPLPGGGSIDVSLERDRQFVACEISITTRTGHELENLRKCLAVNADWVLFVSPFERTRRELEALARRRLEARDCSRIAYLGPGEIPLFLDGIVAEQSRSRTTIRGWNVSGSTVSLPPDEATRRKRELARILIGAHSRGGRP